MILIPGKFIYLASPRCASRTVAEVLTMQLGGKKLCGSHHAHASEMSTLALYDEPVISLIRNPYNVVVNRAAYAFRNIGRFKRTRDFKFWLDWYKPDGWNGFGDRIAQYHEYVDHYYVFERGLQSFFTAIGFPDVNIPWIGKDSFPEDRDLVRGMHPQYKQLIDERFQPDVDLYQSVVSRDCHIL
jgi:hypothetical protein